MAIYSDSKDSTPENGYSSFIEKVYSSRLTPTEDGCWKIIFVDNYYSDGTEVQFSEEEIAEICNWSKFKLIPVKNNRWKISIENISDIVHQEDGKYEIVIHSDLLLVMIHNDGNLCFYCPSSEEYMDEEDGDETIANRPKYGNDVDDEYFDNDSEEDNIMRGLKNGDGDPFGF